MFNVALYQPQIPPNTGNIIRLCANSGANLHLILPLGFSIDEKSMRRAGLDYHVMAQVQQHQNFDEFINLLKPQRIFAVSTKGTTTYSDIKFQAKDVLLFGSETWGLPNQIRNSELINDIIRIPMQENNRSLNLSNSVAIILYEAWKQLNFILK